MCGWAFWGFLCGWMVHVLGSLIDQCVFRVFQTEVIFSIVAASASMAKYHTFLRFRRDCRLSTMKSVGSTPREVICAVISSADVFFLVFQTYFTLGFL